MTDLYEERRLGLAIAKKIVEKQWLNNGGAERARGRVSNHLPFRQNYSLYVSNNRLLAEGYEDGVPWNFGSPL